ncbi:hypothetical protein CRYUN_Cryun13aG0033500 [Craigia yunnanensis]
MKEAFRLHKEMLESGLTPNAFTSSSLIDGHCKEGRVSETLSFFLEKTRAGIPENGTDEMGDLVCSPNHVMYTSLIQALYKDGHIFEASKIFSDMRCSGLILDVPSYIVNLEGHFQAKHLIDVMMLHADLIKMGIMPSIAINLVIARGYQEIGDLRSALKCSEDLAVQGLGVLNQREQNELEYRVNEDKNVTSGNLLDAHYIFDEIPSKNIISWTALISAYVVNQKPQKAVELFRKMQMLNVEPDQVTITVALSACADLGALEMGEWIHAYVRRKPELKADLRLNNALINMYAKCGEIETSRNLFDSLGEKDVTTWTSMIVGHALHGQANEVLELFCKMEEIGQRNSKNQDEGNRGSSIIVPNDVTFIGVLMACSHGGMVEEGKKYYQSMSEDYGFKPRDTHFGCMVDLFCRAGLLKEAYNFIFEMPGLANAVMWRTLLGACNLHGEIELGEKVRCQLLELEPRHVGDNVAMSNIYAAKGMWDKKVVFRDQIKQLRRAPGSSSIEVSSYICEFVSGDDDHPLKAEIYEALKYLTVSMKAYGYSPEISSLPEY